MAFSRTPSIRPRSAPCLTGLGGLWTWVIQLPPKFGFSPSRTILSSNAIFFGPLPLMRSTRVQRAVQTPASAPRLLPVMAAARHVDGFLAAAILRDVNQFMGEQAEPAFGARRIFAAREGDVASPR